MGLVCTTDNRSTSRRGGDFANTVGPRIRHIECAGVTIQGKLIGPIETSEPTTVDRVDSQRTCGAVFGVRQVSNNRNLDRRRAASF